MKALIYCALKFTCAEGRRIRHAKQIFGQPLPLAQNEPRAAVRMTREYFQDVAATGSPAASSEKHAFRDIYFFRRFKELEMDRRHIPGC